MPIGRVYSKSTKQAAILLGKQIKLVRKHKKWSELELGTRAGIARATLQKIEKGNLTIGIGLFFEVATLVGINLFEQEAPRLDSQIANLDKQINLLPKSVHKAHKEVDDDF